MINPDIQENINIKTEQAHECAAKALQLCENYSRTQKPKYLKEMGGYFGTFVNNLRSAFNYASVDYCTQRGFKKNRNKKNLSTDFPYALTEANFKRIELVSLMSQSDPNLYAFIEKMQPYHPKEKFLGNIMKLSNMDKHNILVKPQEMNLNIVKILDEGYFEPRHFGSTVLVGVSNGEPVFVDTPCYVPQLRMFALPNGRWLNFMIPINGYFLEFIPFIRNGTNQARKILSDFYSLWN